MKNNIIKATKTRSHPYKHAYPSKQDGAEGLPTPLPPNPTTTINISCVIDFAVDLNVRKNYHLLERKLQLTSILLNSVPKLLDAKKMTTLDELGDILTCRAMLV